MIPPTGIGSAFTALQLLVDHCQQVINNAKDAANLGIELAALGNEVREVQELEDLLEGKPGNEKLQQYLASFRRAVDAATAHLVVDVDCRPAWHKVIFPANVSAAMATVREKVSAARQNTLFKLVVLFGVRAEINHRGVLGSLTSIQTSLASRDSDGQRTQSLPLRLALEGSTTRSAVMTIRPQSPCQATAGEDQSPTSSPDSEASRPSSPSSSAPSLADSLSSFFADTERVTSIRLNIDEQIPIFTCFAHVVRIGIDGDKDLGAMRIRFLQEAGEPVPLLEIASTGTDVAVALHTVDATLKLVDGPPGDASITYHGIWNRMSWGASSFRLSFGNDCALEAFRNQINNALLPPPPFPDSPVSPALPPTEEDPTLPSPPPASTDSNSRPCRLCSDMLVTDEPVPYEKAAHPWHLSCTDCRRGVTWPIEGQAPKATTAMWASTCPGFKKEEFTEHGEALLCYRCFHRRQNKCPVCTKDIIGKWSSVCTTLWHKTPHYFCDGMCKQQWKERRDGKAAEAAKAAKKLLEKEKATAAAKQPSKEETSEKEASKKETTKKKATEEEQSEEEQSEKEASEKDLSEKE
ncbi:hypothetical protein JCM6882_000219 [Rhodosporidiobolus microsporus]